MTKKIYGTIYCLINNINGKKYYGQTTTYIKKYLKTHKYNANMGSNQLIHRAIKKYGWNNFKKEIVCKCENKLTLDLMEDFCINFFNTLFPNGYNLMRGGSHGKHNSKTLQKMSEKMKGKNNPMYGRTGEKNPMYNIPPWNKGLTKEVDKRLKNRGDNMSGKNNPFYGIHLYGKDHPFYGKHHTKEIKKILSNSMKEMWNDPIKRKKRIKAYKKASLVKEKCPYCKKDFSIMGIGTHKKYCKKHKV